MAQEAKVMDLLSFYDLIRDQQFEKAHRWVDKNLEQASDDDARWLHHRRTSIYLGERRYQDAIEHLSQHRNICGTSTSVHDTLAMLYEVTGQDELALNELETAPYDADQSADPLLIADAKFYRIYFRARRGLPVDQSEIDAFPSGYETYLPSDGKIRGCLVKKDDISKLMASMLTKRDG